MQVRSKVLRLCTKKAGSMEFRSSEISLESRRLFQPTPLFRAKFLLLLQGHMAWKPWGGRRLTASR